MQDVDKVIEGIRQESRFGQYFGIGVFLLVVCAAIATSLQGHTTAASDRPLMMCLMLLGFLGLAYSRILSRVADVAQAVSKGDAASSSR